jgi:hypothetical protein
MSPEVKRPPIRRTVLATANWHVVQAGVGLALAGVPKDAEELKLLREVVRLLEVRGADSIRPIS